MTDTQMYMMIDEKAKQHYQGFVNQYHDYPEYTLEDLRADLDNYEGTYTTILAEMPKEVKFLGKDKILSVIMIFRKLQGIKSLL